MNVSQAASGPGASEQFVLCCSQPRCYLPAVIPYTGIPIPFPAQKFPPLLSGAKSDGSLDGGRGDPRRKSPKSPCFHVVMMDGNGKTLS